MTWHLKCYAIIILCHNCTRKSCPNKDVDLVEEVEEETEIEADDEENSSNNFSSYSE